MDIKEELIRGLTSEQKYIPLWYRYDKQGSVYNDMCFDDPKYYLHRSEMSVLNGHVQEMVDLMKNECVLVDLGSGNSAKTRLFIDALLQKQGHLKYIPVDISAECIAEVSATLEETYSSKLTVSPLYGEYNEAIDTFGQVRGSKLILWFGSVQNLSLQDQIQLLQRLSKNMEENDKLFVSMDITNNVEDVYSAYLDTSGVCAKLYCNAAERLNRDYDGNIDLSKFQLTGEYRQTTLPEDVSFVTMKLRSIGDQTVEISGLGLELQFKDGEFLNLYERDGISCKYTLEQIQSIVSKGNQRICKQWISKDRHVAFSCLVKSNGFSNFKPLKRQ